MSTPIRDAALPAGTSPGRLRAASVVVYVVLVLAAGVWASVATGEWIALLCASGLAALPMSAHALRSRNRR